MYLTYNEYLGMGGSVDENAFARLEAKARAHLDRITFGRLVNAEALPDSVKYCMFDLLNAASADESAGAIAAGREIAAMGNDGVSVTFASGATGNAAKTVSARYAAIVRTWLAHETDSHGIPLLYSGVDA